MRNPKLIWITAGIKAAGGTPPKYLAAIDDNTKKVFEQIREAPRAETPYVGVVAAWVDAVLADRDPITDPDVLRTMLNSVLYSGSLDHAAGNVIENRAIEDLSIDVAEIVTLLKKATDNVGKELTAAHAILGDVDLDDIPTVFSMGPDAVSAHQSVERARKLIRTLDLAWVALAELTRFTMVPEFNRRMADLDIDQWQATRNVKDPWDIVRAGGTIDLAFDHNTVLKRQARIENEKHERDEAPARAEKAARQAQGQRLLAQSGRQ